MKYCIFVFSPELNIYQLAESIDAVLSNLKIINKVLSEVNFDYVYVFEKLGEAGIDLKYYHKVPLEGSPQGK